MTLGDLQDFVKALWRMQADGILNVIALRLREQLLGVELTGREPSTTGCEFHLVTKVECIATGNDGLNGHAMQVSQEAVQAVHLLVLLFDLHVVRKLHGGATATATATESKVAKMVTGGLLRHRRFGQALRERHLNERVRGGGGRRDMRLARRLAADTRDKAAKRVTWTSAFRRMHGECKVICENGRAAGNAAGRNVADARAAIPQAHDVDVDGIALAETTCRLLAEGCGGTRCGWRF